MQTVRVEGRVAQILSARQLVINRGRLDGVISGMKFEIKAESPIEITDPDTEQVLDVVDRVKVRVVATEVRDRISICSTFEYRESGSIRIPAELSRALESAGPYRKVPITLHAADSQLPTPLDPEESYVERGDRAIQIIEPE